MRVLVAPDSFKGSMSAGEVCSVVSEALVAALPGYQVDCIPVADGGEGTAASFVFASGAELKEAWVTAPDYRKVKAEFAVMGDTAVVEMAQASGLPLVDGKNDPLRATTYGTGELILAALDFGCRHIVLGIGGSATTDGGIGCLSALGIKFLDKNGVSVSFDGIGASNVSSIDISGIDSRIAECDFTVLCDVENPLYGENGAAFVYSPQKGADESAVAFLDGALRNLEKVVLKDIGTDCACIAGSGAAGGMGYGLRVFLGAKLQSGAKTMLDLCGFDERSSESDVIITGEGRFDRQSLMGKVPSEVIKRSGDKPVVVVCGMSTLESADEVAAVFETNPFHLPFEQVLPMCKDDLYSVIFNDVSHFLKKIEKNP